MGEMGNFKIKNGGIIVPWIYVLTVFTGIFAALCVIFRSKNLSFEGMICKFMASLGFIGVAIIGNYINPVNIKYFSYILAALMLGFCGDVFLGIKEIAPIFRQKLIPIGLAFFLVSHIFAVVAFSTFDGFKPVTLLGGVLGVILALILIKSLKIKVPIPLVIALCLYYGMLIWKIFFAIALVLNSFSSANLLLLIGSFLFFFSDSVLGVVYFTRVKRKNALVSVELSTYYAAQILFALSIVLL